MKPESVTTNKKVEWPKNMQPTGKSYLGFHDGECVAISVQFSGSQGVKENAQTVLEFAKNGYDIQTMDHERACEIFHKSMNERNAKKKEGMLL